MSVESIARTIAEVLAELQKVSGRPCPELTADTKPIGDLDGFDSLSGIEATVAVEASVGKELGIDNLFVGVVKGHKRALSIKEAAERIAKSLETSVA